MTIPRKQAPWILGNWSQDVLPRLIPAAGKETMDQGLAKISKDVNPHVCRPMLQRAQSAQTRVRSVSCPLARRVAGLDSKKKREDEDAASLRGGLYCNEPSEKNDRHHSTVTITSYSHRDRPVRRKTCAREGRAMGRAHTRNTRMARAGRGARAPTPPRAAHPRAMNMTPVPSAQLKPHI